jgi:hypothetical protein
MGCTLSSSRWFSIDKIPRVTSPVLVIHGTEDEVSEDNSTYQLTHNVTVNET